MALASLIKDLNFDRYDRNARLQPALLVLLPAFLMIGIWYPAARTGSGWVASVLVACGATFMLAQATRRRGRAVEQAWGDRIGRRHSARLLSFEDHTLSLSYKERIADWISRHGPGLPTHEEERLNPRSAEDRRLTAVKWLLEATRADAAGSMLLAENVSYGFWRNMLGLRPIGITVGVASIVCDAFLLWRVGVADARFWPGTAFLAGAVAAVIAWAFLVSRRSVEDASLAFAERLFAQIDNPVVAQRLAASARD